MAPCPWRPNRSANELVLQKTSVLMETSKRNSKVHDLEISMKKIQNRSTERKEMTQNCHCGVWSCITNSHHIRKRKLITVGVHVCVIFIHSKPTKIKIIFSSLDCYSARYLITGPNHNFILSPFYKLRKGEINFKLKNIC